MEIKKAEGEHQPNAQPVVFHSLFELEVNPETACLTAACRNIILKNVKLFFPLSKNRAMCKLNQNLDTHLKLAICFGTMLDQKRERSQKSIHNKRMVFLIPEK